MSDAPVSTTKSALRETSPDSLARALPSDISASAASSRSNVAASVTDQSVTATRTVNRWIGRTIVSNPRSGRVMLSSLFGKSYSKNPGPDLRTNPSVLSARSSPAYVILCRIMNERTSHAILTRLLKSSELLDRLLVKYISHRKIYVRRRSRDYERWSARHIFLDVQPVCRVAAGVIQYQYHGKDLRCPKIQILPADIVCHGSQDLTMTKLVCRLKLHADRVVLDLPARLKCLDKKIKSVVGRDCGTGVTAPQHEPLNVVSAQVGNDVAACPAFSGDLWQYDLN